MVFGLRAKARSVLIGRLGRPLNFLEGLLGQIEPLIERVQLRPGLQTHAVARSPSALVDECILLWSLAAAPGSDRVDARALRFRPSRSEAAPEPG
jgi:hypothetical protein